MMTGIAGVLAVLLLSAVALGAEPRAGVEIVAHRGASKDAPENTLAAYRLAWEQGADAIECDLRFTQDQQIICMHDASPKRTTGVEGDVARMTLDQLRQLDAGKWKGNRWAGEKLPTLPEILALVPPGKKILIELKTGPEIVPLLQRQIEESKLEPGQIRIISGKIESLAAVKRAMPQLKTYWVAAFRLKDGVWNMTHEQAMKKLKESRADGLDVSFTEESAEMVNADFARRLREAGIGLHVWTVDNPTLAARAIELGALSITTNRPAVIRAALRP